MLERADRIGGLLRYGIPEFKMEKRHIDRRLEQMEAEGTEFRTNAVVGDNVDIGVLQASYDAIVLAAAGLYALEHNVARLAADHALARELARVLDGREPGAEAVGAKVDDQIRVREIEDRPTGHAEDGVGGGAQALVSAHEREARRTAAAHGESSGQLQRVGGA